jgi:hypothetical protein
MKATSPVSLVRSLTKKQQGICDGNSESRNAYVLAKANPADSSKDDVTHPSCYL